MFFYLGLLFLSTLLICLSLINALINIWYSYEILFTQVQRYLCINHNFVMLKLCSMHSTSPHHESLYKSKFNDAIHINWPLQICKINVIQTLNYLVFLTSMLHLLIQKHFFSFWWFCSFVLLLLKVWAISLAHANIKRTDNSTVYHSTVTKI